MNRIILLLTFLVTACSSSYEEEDIRLRLQNQKGEYIYRQDQEHLIQIDLPERVSREPYPWESE